MFFNALKMRNLSLVLITIIISIYALATVQFEGCSFGFSNSRIATADYCPLSTIDLTPVTFINVFTEDMNGIVISLTLGLIFLGLVVFVRLSNFILIENKIIRWRNACSNSRRLWLNQFGSGFMSGSYL